MRESLGWITNCGNEPSCPQNWLERAVTELPTHVACHVCGREVQLVLSEDEVGKAQSDDRLASFPVVPPVSMGPASPAASEARPAVSPRTARPAVAVGDESAAEAAPPTPLPTPRQWVCTLASGESIRIDKDPMIIGRSRTCDVVIASAKVSRQHASLTTVGGELWISDLGSANGVWHGGEKIQRTKVANGDTFTISGETLLFEVR